MVACDFDYSESRPNQIPFLKTVVHSDPSLWEIKAVSSPCLQGSSLEGGCQGYNHATVLLLGYNAFPFLSVCEVQSERNKVGITDIQYF